MSHFPVSNSNLSAAHLAEYVRRQYLLNEPVQCRLVRAGINDTYIVESGDQQFVFRVYSKGWRSVPEIEEEIRLLLQLQQKSIAVSYPLADRNGNFIQTFDAPEGERPGVLFTYAPGEKLHNYAEDIHTRIGALMARFHSATEGQKIKRLTYTAQTLLIDPMQELAVFLSGTTAEMAMMRSMQQVLLRELANADTETIRKGVVHLDIWFDNLNISKDGTVTLFDFDFCGNGWLCLDIGYYLMQLYVVEPVAAEFEAKARAFLNGYEMVQPLSREEHRLLPALGVCLYFFYLGTQCQRFDNYSNVFLSETYLKRYITHRVKKYFDFHSLG